MKAPKFRPYQNDAIAGARKAFIGDKAAGIDPARAVIVTMPTGTGKSLIFLAIAMGVVERGRTALLLVEGVKLVQQAAAHLRAAGLTVGIEMAEETAVPESRLSKPQRELFAKLPLDGEGLLVKGPAVLSAGILCDLGLARRLRPAQAGAGGWYQRIEPVRPQVVVASVDSMINRLDHYPVDSFRMIIYDEAHHILAPTSLAIIRHFGISVPLNEPKDIADLKKSEWKGDTLLLGLTATPDRGDKRDLMRVFQVVGYEYDIRSAIQDGWLVPIRQEFCHLEGLDLRQVRKSAGDLDARQLCELLEPLMVPICESIKQVSAGRPTLCYSPLCNLANSTTAQLRLIAPDKQIHTITGETEDAQREAWFAGLDKGEVWALSSVGTLTEGVDLPRAAVAAMLRLTMSRLLYAQILGRVLRPAPEIAHALNDCATAEERRAMIAASSKPTATILDFAGNSGKHKLVRAIDILADDEDPAKKMAEIIMEKGEVDPFEALERARAELAVMLEKARGKDIQRILVSPFDLLDVPATKDAWGRPATDRQIASLLEAGVIDYRKSFPKLDPREREAAELRAREEAIAKLRKLFDMTSASIVLAERSRRIDEDMANPKQLRVLIKAGIPAGCARAMGFKTASAAIDQLSAMAWKATPMWIERWSAARMEAAA
jgi:superfamily II DNA or RNA helicase